MYILIDPQLVYMLSLLRDREVNIRLIGDARNQDDGDNRIKLLQ
jgi:hypothetical protein